MITCIYNLWVQLVLCVCGCTLGWVLVNWQQRCDFTSISEAADSFSFDSSWPAIFLHLMVRPCRIFLSIVVYKLVPTWWFLCVNIIFRVHRCIPLSWLGDISYQLGSYDCRDILSSPLWFSQAMGWRDSSRIYNLELGTFQSIILCILYSCGTLW